MNGLCECGCGGRPKLAKQNHARLGYVRGKPMHFIFGHQSRGRSGKLSPSYIHGGKRDPLYGVWKQMRMRCFNERHPFYRYYGARGIGIASRWDDFRHFRDDMGPRPAGMTLERLDGTKDYKPSNCRWATRTEQANNKSDNIIVRLDGESMTLTQACSRTTASYSTVRARFKRGWSIEDALFRPVAIKHKRKRK